MKVNDTVRIVRDEHEELIGVMARIEKMGPDGTTAWLVKPGAKMGVWCALSHLEVVMCSMHTDQMLVWEDGGPQDITVHGRWYCAKCSESLMRALDDVEAGRLHDLDDVIKDFGFTREELEAEIAQEKPCFKGGRCGNPNHWVADPRNLPFGPDSPGPGTGQSCEWRPPTQHPLLDPLCDALTAAREGTYDGLTVEEHLEVLIERLKES
jgi:hypothetical protein